MEAVCITERLDVKDLADSRVFYSKSKLIFHEFFSFFNNWV